MGCYQVTCSGGTYPTEVSWVIQDWDTEEVLLSGEVTADPLTLCLDMAVPSAEPTPTPVPTTMCSLASSLAVTDVCCSATYEDEYACQDDSSWHYSKKWKNCDWVADNPSSRCSKKGDTDEEEDIKAKHACLFSCGECPDPTPAPTVSPACSDSGTWMKVGSDASDEKDCDWVADNAEGRCDVMGEDGLYAYQSCMAACYEDEDDWVYDHNGKEKSCSYVGKKPSSRCEEVGGDGTTGYESCPLACDTCGTYTTGLLVDDDFLNQ